MKIIKQRVSDKLNGRLEATKLKFNTKHILEVKAFLNQVVIIGFN